MVQQRRRPWRCRSGVEHSGGWGLRATLLALCTICNGRLRICHLAVLCARCSRFTQSVIDEATVQETGLQSQSDPIWKKKLKKCRHGGAGAQTRSNDTPTQPAQSYLRHEILLCRIDVHETEKKKVPSKFNSCFPHGCSRR